MQKKKIKVTEATYIKKAESIAIVGECPEGRLTNQIHKDCFYFGNMSQEEIDFQMDKTAKMMLGKTITIAYDPNIDVFG